MSKLYEFTVHIDCPHSVGTGWLVTIQASNYEEAMDIAENEDYDFCGCGHHEASRIGPHTVRKIED
ncbi:MAG: hypothetical protein ACOCQD_00720 [archaeon]